ncbi:hypothetical protein P5673_017474 [Acropora cervicornis]|uniref:EGF-like domain-containing protein n=1 Tax=Acropora cervicornis TaxID=6130 RepID=A0AAD9QEQ3_ACRCE|nr:hypothetical protein P5673_017474 [Acropora cervicornis]
MIKMSPRTLCSKASCSPKVLKILLAAGLVLVVLLAVSLALLIHQQSKASDSDESEKLADKRSMAILSDCRHKQLCDVKATCTAVSDNHHACLCNGGFQGNGSVCYGKETVYNTTTLQYQSFDKLRKYRL